MTLIGNELVKVTGITPTGGPSGQEEQTTVQDIANLGISGGEVTSLIAGTGIFVNHPTGAVTVTNTVVGANPSTTAGPTVVNGVATTYMRSDATPAIQKASSSQFGLVEVDNVTITSVAGVISAVSSASSGANPSATAGPTAINGSASTFLRSDGAPAIQLGTAAQKGIVQVDGTTLTVSGGVISVLSGSGALPPDVITLPNGKVIVGNGLAKGNAVDISGDGTITNAGVLTINRASTTVFGVVKVDGTTITSSGGVISAVAGTGYTDEQAQDAVGGILTGISYNDSTPSIAAIRVVQIQVTDPNGSALTTGNGKAYFRVNSQLNGYNLTAVAAAVTTVSSSGTPTFQVYNFTDSVNILSTTLTIDANETDSSTAAIPAVIDTAHDDVTTADMLRIDCSIAGTGTTGLIVELTFTLP